MSCMVFVTLLCCVDYGGVNVFYVCLNFGVVYGVGACVNVCGVVCVVCFLCLGVVCSGCVGYCDFCLICHTCNWRCSFIVCLLDVCV